MSQAVRSAPNEPALRFQLVFWLFAFTFWLFFTKNHHPTWLLRFGATLMLLSGSALFAIFCWPRTLRPTSLGISLLQLALVGSAAALVIHMMYDVLVGDDPLRFGFWQNAIMDTAFVGVNACVAALVATVLRAVFGGSSWFVIQFKESQAAQQR